MHRYLLPLVLGVATLGSACAGEYRASATVSTRSPDLVYVNDGVYAVANYDEPVYFADNYYWRYDDGYWYRSRTYTSGWEYYARPPVVVARIERPYARYRRADGRVHIDYRYQPSERNRPVEIREHRSRRVERDRYPDRRDRDRDRPRVIDRR